MASRGTEWPDFALCPHGPVDRNGAGVPISGGSCSGGCHCGDCDVGRGRTNEWCCNCGCCSQEWAKQVGSNLGDVDGEGGGVDASGL